MRLMIEIQSDGCSSQGLRSYGHPPEGEKEAKRDERLERFDRTNGKLCQLIMYAVHKCSTVREWIQSYKGSILAFNILEALMKRFAPKRERLLSSLDN